MQAFRSILFFVIAVAAQVLIFNHINLFGYANPYIYIIYLLLLPVSTSRTNMLMIAFLLGFLIDIFENTGGVHAAASVFLAFSRPLLLNIAGASSRDEERDKINKLSLPSRLLYFLLGVVLHHTVLYFTEAFGFNYVRSTLLRILYSSVFTFACILFVQFWNFKRPKKGALR